MLTAKTAAVLTTALALALVAVPAHAGAPREPSGLPPSTELSMTWDGHEGHHTLSGSLFGDRTIVPGDTAEATIAVRNGGPTDGTLAVSIVNTQLHRPEAAAHDGLADDLRINGIPVAELIGTRVMVHEAPLAQGATTTVPVTYDFPAAAVSGNRADIGPVEVSFDVHLRITADPSRDPGNAVGHDSDASGQTTTGPSDGIIAQTGGRLAAAAGWLVPTALMLIVIATLAAHARNRTRAGQR